MPAVIMDRRLFGADRSAEAQHQRAMLRHFVGTMDFQRVFALRSATQLSRRRVDECIRTRVAEASVWRDACRIFEAAIPTTEADGLMTRSCDSFAQCHARWVERRGTLIVFFRTVGKMEFNFSPHSTHR